MSSKNTTRLVTQSPTLPPTNQVIGTIEQEIWSSLRYTPMKANGNEFRTWRLVAAGDLLDSHHDEDIELRFYIADDPSIGPLEGGKRVASVVVPKAAYDVAENGQWYVHLDVISYRDDAGVTRFKGYGFILTANGVMIPLLPGAASADPLLDHYLMATMRGSESGSNANITVSMVTLESLN